MLKSLKHMHNAYVQYWQLPKSDLNLGLTQLKRRPLNRLEVRTNPKRFWRSSLKGESKVDRICLKCSFWHSSLVKVKVVNLKKTAHLNSKTANQFSPGKGTFCQVLMLLRSYKYNFVKL
jgi:hypothetical protein